MMRRLVLPVAMVLLAAGCGSAGSPVSTSPPAYQEGRAFPSCTVPIYVSANVPDRPRVKAAAAEFGRLSGYAFRDLPALGWPSVDYLADRPRQRGCGPS